MERHSQTKVIDLEIYTDGSCKGNSIRYGGWAFLVINDSKMIYYNTGSAINTTSQRMELQAIAEALHWCENNREHNQQVIIHSDSAYAINCYRQHWYENWQRNGWRNSKGDDVANADLWGEIIPYFSNLWYIFKKVDGHSGVFWNEKCDEYAQGAAETLKKTWRG